jgi:hypothetical protein
MELTFTDTGYLIVPALTARRYFPRDLLFAMVREGELWLLPAHRPAAGGLLMKQRNAAGDRSVLIWEMLPGGTPDGMAPGTLTGYWDADAGALRIPLTDDASPTDRAESTADAPSVEASSAEHHASA